VLREPRHHVYIAPHKPKGCVTTVADPEGRQTVMHLLRGVKERVFPVGRLDYNSEGLLFLTNDGAFSLRLTHPRYGVSKKYLATVEGRVEEQTLSRFLHGVWYEGERFKAQKVRLVSAGRSQSVVELELAEGKYREVRRLFESQGLVVQRLQRIQIGKIKLGELRPGKWRTLTESEIKTLMS
jgi:23S rRNA pseudouridine2605 synthase